MVKWQSSSGTLAKAVQWSVICFLHYRWSSGSSEISVSFATDIHEASLPAFVARSHLLASWLHLTVKINMRMKKRREDGTGQDWFSAIFFFPLLLVYVIWLLQAHSYLAPGEVLLGSQPAILEAERPSYSHSAQGFHSKICPHFACGSHTIPPDWGTQATQATTLPLALTGSHKKLRLKAIIVFLARLIGSRARSPMNVSVAVFLSKLILLNRRQVYLVPAPWTSVEQHK